ncbi:hypothetical protein IMG5_200340 [Ichthyophthirius multifiliis]|uniref:Transmembrane protein n=1 Tax=Ichthyophthirius multifiliis TaxID=5932 RepID=G0R5Q9_ICHMU|nr:hypothetical protein IMG5_200340 [Ichthyophthirius multifiliis]EGR27189.1 hypothetical protein IMG5_200340 [Ichthyophthirius multifiliis]|eukprot:XP_004024073.1 hypothetical protein IMG5_200340 [Ichthyophthirius multifiliis]
MQTMKKMSMKFSIKLVKVKIFIINILIQPIDVLMKLKKEDLREDLKKLRFKIQIYLIIKILLLIQNKLIIQMKMMNYIMIIITLIMIINQMNKLFKKKQFRIRKKKKKTQIIIINLKMKIYQKNYVIIVINKNVQFSVLLIVKEVSINNVKKKLSKVILMQMEWTKILQYSQMNPIWMKKDQKDQQM